MEISNNDYNNVFGSSDSCDKNEDFLLSILKKKDTVEVNIPKHSKINISTKTANCRINANFNIKNMCKEIDNLLKNKNKVDSNGKRKVIKSNITKIKYSKTSDNKDILVKNSKINNNFFNSITVGVNIRQDKDICLMIFTNGLITCTGCKNDEDGLIAANLFLNELKLLNNIFDENIDKTEIKVVDYTIVMINSNFSIGFYIDNLKLYNLLLENRNEYNLFTDYDPDKYQGVKIYFMWNENQKEKNGICVCNKKCKYSAKKKKGEGENDCRRISIAVFSTGKILIAGSRSNEQLMDTYNFVIKILQSNYKDIVQYSIHDNENNELINNFKKVNGIILKKLKIKK